MVIATQQETSFKKKITRYRGNEKWIQEAAWQTRMNETILETLA